jgi:hypothetical protein
MHCSDHIPHFPAVLLRLPTAGGTRFIGVYLARQLVEAGHEVTLLTRGKKPVTYQIPDDTDESFAAYAAAVKHLACDRSDPEAMKAALTGKGFQVRACAHPALCGLSALGHTIHCRAARRGAPKPEAASDSLPPAPCVAPCRWCTT